MKNVRKKLAYSLLYFLEALELFLVFKGIISLLSEIIRKYGVNDLLLKISFKMDRWFGVDSIEDLHTIEVILFLSALLPAIGLFFAVRKLRRKIFYSYGKSYGKGAHSQK